MLARFREHLGRLVDADPDARSTPWLVAVSGGLDSMVLLHLLRSVDRAPLHVGHVDHRMREGSDRDADWLRGVCRAWSVPVSVRTLDAVPTSETAARASRYEALEQVRDALDAPFIVTAHHADDVAETVLLRAARGTGPHGLASIMARANRRLRPLLPFTRDEVAAYAAAVGLRWRDDPTNLSLDIPRNVVRHEVIPTLESSVAPGAGKALARLAVNAGADREAWDEVQTWIDDRLSVESTERGVSADLAALRSLGPALRAKALTIWVRRLGVRLDRTAVTRAEAFVADGASGHGIDLGEGVRLRIELDRAVLAFEPPESDRGPDAPLVIESPARGVGGARLGGRVVRVAWAPHSHVLQRGHVPTGVEARFEIDALRFPLSVRGRAPGDRIRTPVGHRKVKKVLLEARIPEDVRDRVPLLVDADGDVVWIPGIARRWRTDESGRMLTVRVES